MAEFRAYLSNGMSRGYTVVEKYPESLEVSLSGKQMVFLEKMLRGGMRKNLGQLNC